MTSLTLPPTRSSPESATLAGAYGGLSHVPVDDDAILPSPRMVWMDAEGQLVRGDIWSVDFGVDPEDPEQAFRRPALIVSDDRLHHPNLRMVIVVPGTSTIRPVPLHVVVEANGDTGLAGATAFQVEQVRAVSSARLVERLGRLDPINIHTIGEILRNALRL